jgi:hypothetical protein
MKLILRKGFEIQRIRNLKAAGWSKKNFLNLNTRKVDPRLHISMFDSGKKHYPRTSQELSAMLEDKQ